MCKRPATWQGIVIALPVHAVWSCGLVWMGIHDKLPHGGTGAYVAPKADPSGAREFWD